MPSENLMSRALETHREPGEAFRSAVARTVDEIRGRLASRALPDAADRWTAELGPLGTGRMDATRVAELLGADDPLDPRTADHMQAALEVLAELDAEGPDAFVHRIPTGADLREEAGRALALLGRAFGAARVAALARTGRFRPEDHGDFLQRFPPEMWNQAERTIAPPLVLELEGADLRPAALGDLLDGGQKLVLAVRGAAPPASLAPLVSPGVMVIQTEDPEEMGRAASFDGPAICALFPEGSGAALFVHDPDGGPTPTRRLEVDRLPEADGLRPVGTITIYRQAQELGQLATLASLTDAPDRTAGAPAANGDGHDSDAAAMSEEEPQPADRLAAWLLRQASLDEVG